jgi:formamidopyrimidine-DNA glycosylase
VTLRRADLRLPIPENLKKNLEGTQVTDVRRRSKYLLIDFSNCHSLILHLGMSGRFFFTESRRVLDRHDHVLFDFDKSLHLRLRDPRRFGVLLLSRTASLSEHKLFCHLGPEPLEKKFSAGYFHKVCQKSHAPIKNFIMNAKHVVGVGNIYAAEALFLSGIRPTRKACQLTKLETENLCRTIKEVLCESIQSGGTSFRDYVGADEESGLHQLKLNVYDREGEACHHCQNRIRRIVQAGRSGFYCSKCQK